MLLKRLRLIREALFIFLWYIFSMSKLSETLRERGYVYQHSSETLEEITDGPERTVYLGIDPSADSLHVGNLVGLLVLRHFLEAGHKVIILTGGGTGMIGDPGGKSEERNLLDAETVAHNTKAVADQIRRVFGSSDFVEVNNADWLRDIKLLEFLRDVGKHFTVNAMIKKDIVRDRLEGESPISFTEFSYALLQGYDFLHLNESHQVSVQVGGSDQWSNILAGVEYVRRKSDTIVYALTWPLVINKSTGKKFGKSESGAVWLDPTKTSPFQLYQFFINTEDDFVEELLLKMTLLSKVDIDSIMTAHSTNPAERIAQKKLAEAVTTLVHGAGEAEVAAQVSAILFGTGSFAEMNEATARMLASSVSTCTASTGEQIEDVLVRSGLSSSKREARQFLEDGAITLNGNVVTTSDMVGEPHYGIGILRRGKRSVAVLTIS